MAAKASMPRFHKTALSWIIDEARAWPDRSAFQAAQLRNMQGHQALCCGVAVGRFMWLIGFRCLPAEVAGQIEVLGESPMREIITLQCPTCKNRNYSTTKNKKTTTGRLEFSKFCNTCRKHTDHKETK